MMLRSRIHAKLNVERETFTLFRWTARTLGAILVVWISVASTAVCCEESNKTHVENDDTTRPDVLMIVVDDLNDWISLLHDDAPIQTPNLERLASRGTLFSQAYCVSPACNPSRVATLTGLRPTTSGVYGNRSDWRRAVPERETIMQVFLANGYVVKGAGKVFHHHLNGAFHDEPSFSSFQPMAEQQYPDRKLNGAPNYGSRNTDWGVWPTDREQAIDYQTVSYCVDALADTDSVDPLFLVCGIYKPHSPFFAPAEYHELHQSLEVPARLDDDIDDLPPGALSLLQSKMWFWEGMSRLDHERPGAYLEFVRSYAACVSFVDAQVGRLLDALDRRSTQRETIVVLWSDHGFHLGEKNHIEKFALWEKSTHVPFIVIAPGVSDPGTVCSAPIDLSVLYPTLIELCDLESDAECDGESVVSLIRNPQRDWGYPALMTYQLGNHAVRTQRWRYIRYQDGSEELYDHHSDRNEWSNLALLDEYQAIKEQHRQWIPESEAPPVGDLRRER